MRRVASHYIFWHKMYRMHYVELDDKGAFTGVYPLESEIAGTEFYDGIVIPVLPDAKIVDYHEISVPSQRYLNFTAVEAVSDVLANEQVSGGVVSGVPVQLLLLRGISLTAAKFSTDNGCCNGYIQRL